ncbi:unnamed protein product [Malus baccata var. baccata]
MIFLSETKMKDHRIDGVRRRLGFQNGFNVSPIGRAGGLSLWWGDSLEVQIVFSSPNIIDAVQRIKGDHRWIRVTGVYGTPYRNEKQLFWDWMIHHFGHSEIPWICGGDFNEYIWAYEKAGGAAILYNRPRYLEDFMNSSNLFDLGFNGPTFTWRGFRYGEWVEERLDRVLVNELWQDLSPKSTVTHGIALASDHCPIIVQSDLDGPKGRRLFRFEAFWAKEEKCLNVVRSCWAHRRHGDALLNWGRKLNTCRSRLCRWSHTKFKRRSHQIQDLLAQLDVLQKEWGPNQDMIKEKSQLIDELRAQEESYWCQRSRVKWLHDRDANTKFFHHSTLHRRRRNTIVRLKGEDGCWVERPDQIRRLVESHFIDIFRSAGQRNWGSLLDCVSLVVTDAMNMGLIASISEDEIKAAALGMGCLKAPGPDGFQGVFYQSFWETIREDVLAVVQALIQDSTIPGTLNAAHIVLIPKVANPESVSQFRPISLCNFSYKILAKVLANRLRVLMPTIISPSQNAFVAGRQIQDSIGIAHELFHFLKGRTAKTKFELGIKLDMQKAYDRVEWDFLEAVMDKMGFCSQWSKFVMGCVRSVQFQVLLNGQPGTQFTPSRGLRQGDPLSPYLFILVGEVLSRMIQGEVDHGRLVGVRMDFSGPIISHLFFADDTLIFLRADEQNCRLLRDLLENYCNASGQQVNLLKSSVFFGANVPASLSVQLGSILGMAVVDNPGTYLGVPAIWGRSKKRGLSYVKGRILEKLQGWKQNSLSRAGKEVLIKAVVQAIPTYPMSIFKFPAIVCQEMDSLVADFWWGNKDGACKLHWVSKDVLGLPKDVGGLGFRNFQEFNDALLAKQCWRLVSDPNSLWARVLKARYFPRCSIWEASKGGRASWAWSSILTGRDMLKLGSHWQILRGQDVRVWVDKWLPSLPLGHPLPLGSVPVSPNLRVSSLICPSSRRWDLNFLLPFLSDSDRKAIEETPIGDLSRNDRIIWGGSRNGIYLVKSGYRWIQSRSLERRDRRLSNVRRVPSVVWKAIWKLEVPPKLRHFLWLTVHNCLPTYEALSRRRSSVSSTCPICLRHAETIEHLFFTCPWVEPIWFGGAMTYKIDRDASHSWVDWLSGVWSDSFAFSSQANWVQTYIAYTCWFIWKTHCDFVFNKVTINPSKVVFAIFSAVGYFLDANAVLGVSRSGGSGGVVPVSRWCAPSSHFFKINVDASWSKVSMKGFAGVIIRAAEGRFVAAARYPLSAPSAAVAEAIALLRRCELGAAMGIQAMIVESDSLDAVKCLSVSLEMGSWDTFPVLARVKQLGEDFQFCRWSWVPRSANGATHELASAGFPEMSEYVWVERPPSSLVFVLNNDGLLCPH